MESRPAKHIPRFSDEESNPRDEAVNSLSRRSHKACRARILLHVDADRLA